jgi:hypothetical protein
MLTVSRGRDYPQFFELLLQRPDIVPRLLQKRLQLGAAPLQVLVVRHKRLENLGDLAAILADRPLGMLGGGVSEGDLRRTMAGAQWHEASGAVPVRPGGPPRRVRVGGAAGSADRAGAGGPPFAAWLGGRQRQHRRHRQLHTALVLEHTGAGLGNAGLREEGITLLLHVVALVQRGLEARLPSERTRMVRGEASDGRAGLLQLLQEGVVRGLGHLGVDEGLGEALRRRSAWLKEGTRLAIRTFSSAAFFRISSSSRVSVSDSSSNACSWASEDSEPSLQDAYADPKWRARAGAQRSGRRC